MINYKLKYEKYKNKYINIKKLSGGGKRKFDHNDSEKNISEYINLCYFIHPTNLTSINDNFCNNKLKNNIHNITNIFLIPIIHIILENIDNEIIKNQNEFEKKLKINTYYLNIFILPNNNKFIKNYIKKQELKLLLINFKLKKIYDERIIIIINEIIKNFETNKTNINIENINTFNTILNEIINPKIILDNILLKSKIDQLNKLSQDCDNLEIPQSSNALEIPQSSNKLEIINEFNPDIKYIKKIKFNNIIYIFEKIIFDTSYDFALIIITSILFNNNTYTDFFVLKLKKDIQININDIYKLITLNTEIIKSICNNNFIPNNIIDILNNNPNIINYDLNKKDICQNTNTNYTKEYNKLDSIIVDDSELYIDKIKKYIDYQNKIYYNFILNEIKQKIDIVNINVLNNYIIIATTAQLLYSNKLYYNNGNLEHAEQLLLNENNTDTIDDIYIIKFRYTDTNIRKLLNNNISQEDFNNLLTIQCGIPCQACLNIIKQKNIKNILFTNEHGNIIQLDNKINETYKTTGYIFLNYDEHLYKKYIIT